MKNIAVVGMQWGDEGKGKIVDFLSSRADVVVRFQGGHNAGHTIMHNNKIYKLSALPSGALNKGVISVIGNGAVIELKTLKKEIEVLRQAGIEINPENLLIAENTPIVLKLHQDIDRIIEAKRGCAKIGTTGRGIGPCYEDKIGRRAVRLCDLCEEGVLLQRLQNIIDYYGALNIISELGPINIETIKSEIMEDAEHILPFSKPVWRYLYNWHQQKKSIVFEGAQGFWLDIDHGTYPFVTSSATVAGQCHHGAGLGLGAIDHVLGVAKAYTTRVGMGPMTSEQNNQLGDHLTLKGKEFGTVTSRKRRCGWFDAVITRQAAQITGINSIALTKLDVLDGLETIKICVKYKYNGKSYDYLPAAANIQSRMEPVYEEVPGWQGSVYKINDIKKLPKNALNYVKKIEELVEKPIALISTSPERQDIMTIDSKFAKIY